MAGRNQRLILPRIHRRPMTLLNQVLKDPAGSFTRERTCN
jgi:hypothetical protein